MAQQAHPTPQASPEDVAPEEATAGRLRGAAKHSRRNTTSTEAEEWWPAAACVAPTKRLNVRASACSRRSLRWADVTLERPPIL